MFLIDWPGGSWEETVKLIVAVLALYLAALWLSLVFWTYRDIRQRTRDPIVQIVAILLPFLFFLPGFWIYQSLRPRYTLAELYERSLEEEALLQDLEDQKACPTCKRRVMDDFLICPSCRTHLKEPCRSCGRPLSYAWVACPFCGLEKPQREPMVQRGRQQQQIPGRQQPRPAPAQQRPAPAQVPPPRAAAPQPAAIPSPAASQPRRVVQPEPAPRGPELGGGSRQQSSQPQPERGTRATGSRIPFGPPSDNDDAVIGS